MNKPPPKAKVNTSSLRPGVTLDGGRYQLTRVLGEGGGGTVWLGMHASMSTPVAIKFPHLEGNGTAARFEDEIKLHVLLSNRHPHFVSILDVGRHHKQCFVVMQYLANGTLSHRILSRKQTDLLASPINWLSVVADALDYMHQTGLVHRDIKPSNILLDHSLSAYISDFGIAKDLSQPNSQIGRTDRLTVAGSVPYLAPELLSGERASARSDQYSLAVTLYEFLTGERPYQASSIVNLFGGQRSQAARPLRAHCPGIPEGLDQIVARALSNSPSERFDDCRAFAAAVAPYWSILWPILTTMSGDRTTKRDRPALPTQRSEADDSPSGCTVDSDMSDCASKLPKSDACEQGSNDSEQTSGTTSRRSIKLSRLNRRKIT